MRALLLLFLPIALTVCSAVGDELRMNQIQVIGTHNSYHIEPSAPMMQLLSATNTELPQSLQYTHRPLPEQLTELGMRQFEIDVFADPEGGLYANPRGRQMLASQNLPAGPDPDPEGEMKKPGFKVFHVQDIDFLTTVRTLDGALRQLRDFSLAHPRHVPIFVLLELKDDAASPLLTKPVKFDAEQLDLLDAAIRNVFDDKHLITPDSVRGGHETLRQAVTTDGWPTLDAARGKLMFAMDNPGHHRDLYLEGHPSLKERVLFVTPQSEEAPEAAFVKLNNPDSGFDQIQKLVKAGFIIRTRADSPTGNARNNDTHQRERAFASGAQMVSTDYPEPDERLSEYQVRFPNGRAVRANPVNGDGNDVADVDQ